MSRLLWTLSLGVFAGALDLSVLSPALPALGHEFGVQTADLAWVFTLYLLVTVLSIALASTLADRYGRRPVYLACLALFAAGSIVAITAPSYAVFLGARAIQALGAGGIFPVATATIGDVVPAGRRGAALGIVAATWGLAAVIGPSIGGLVTHFISWRWIFAANVPLAAVVFALAISDVPAEAPRRRGPLDLLGLALLCMGLLGLMDGLIASRPLIGVMGVVILATFAIWESMAAHPIVPLELLHTPQLIKTYALEIVIGVLEGSLFFIPTVLVGAQGLSYCCRRLHRGARRLHVRCGDSRVGARARPRRQPRRTARRRGPHRAGLSDLCARVRVAAAPSCWRWSLPALDSVRCSVPPRATSLRMRRPESGRATAVGLLSQALIVGQIIGSSLAGGLFGAASSEIVGYRNAYLAFCGFAFIALILAATLKSQRDERSQSLAKAAAGAL